MNAEHRTETIVRCLDDYLAAREATMERDAPISNMKAARGFLKLALEMMIDDIVREIPIVNHTAPMHD